MFVSTLKTCAAAALITVLTAAGATAADQDRGWSHEAGTIPLTVNLTGVQIADGPIYISVQTQDKYQSMSGHGTIIENVTPGNMTTTVKVSEPGDYAVSVWHDMNDNMRFDMTENYMPVEGWGASGTPPKDKAPIFDDVKIKIESFGSEVTVPVNYPKN